CRSAAPDAAVPTTTSQERMTDDDDQPDATEGPAASGRHEWAAPPSHKTRHDVKRAVDRLLDALAPERVVSRAPRIPVPVERHRTPRGCVLQAAAAAVSVTWFPDAATDLALGTESVRPRFPCRARFRARRRMPIRQCDHKADTPGPARRRRVDSPSHAVVRHAPRMPVPVHRGGAVTRTASSGDAWRPGKRCECSTHVPPSFSFTVP
ncbi:MAG: hypothetical protein ACXWZS_10495, partial [Gemmatirosa sp.]